MTDAPEEFEAHEAARDAETEFVYGCISASDGSQNLLISLACDWRGQGYMSDSYSDPQREVIEQTLTSLSIEADEVTESCWGIESHSAHEVRELLRTAPHFQHDAEFESKHAW